MFKKKTESVTLRPGKYITVKGLFKNTRVYAQYEFEAALEDQFDKARAETAHHIGKEMLGLGDIVNDSVSTQTYESLTKTTYPDLVNSNPSHNALTEDQLKQQLEEINQGFNKSQRMQAIKNKLGQS